jgi:hypothetical protein
MIKHFLISFVLMFFSSFLSANEIACQMDRLNLYFSPWNQSDDFTTLNLEGSLASSVFSNLGPPGSEFFKVILKNDWCSPLQGALLCETPKSALAEIEVSTTSSPSSPSHLYLLRYFIAIIQYRDDGWAFLKVRAKREDNAPPITFHTEFPPGSCRLP